jgi:predicted NAD/FAD-binding protein
VANESVCIIGGGATGAALLWCLAQDDRARAETTVTLLHEGSDLGGHSLTVPVSRGGKTLDVDLGVQLISPLIYANVRLMLGLDDFAPMVPMTDYDEVNLCWE